MERTIAFAYTLDQAKLLADQLERFVTLNRHQLAGHRANLDFWLGEAEHVLAAIDGYQQRFERMRDAQQRWVADHGTHTWDQRYCSSCRGPCFDQPNSPPPTPKRISSTQLEAARRRVRDAAYHFLVRLLKTGLLSVAELRGLCVRLDTGVDPADLRQ